MRCTLRGAVAGSGPRLPTTLAVARIFALVMILPLPGLSTATGGDPGGGQLRLLESGGQRAAPFPLRHTDVRASVSGGIASVTVEQTFQNPYDHGIEAVYVFPLPDEAAVDDLEIRIGERIVRGEIRTRQAAREVYEQAKQQGRVAALLDQERPNIFTQQVANIQPGHEIVVRIRYVENLKYENGGYEMVFPTVVGPRYIPGAPVGSTVSPAVYDGGSGRDRYGDMEPGAPERAPGTGWSPNTDRVPDASRITPPVIPPGMRTGQDIMIDVDLDAGVPLQDVQCTSHAADIERRGRSQAHVRLRPADTIPNKDFILRYRVAGAGPEFGMLAHRDAQKPEDLGYFSLLLQPQAEVSDRQARPKEMVFVLDTSGSMHGEPLAKSKAVVRWALQNLGPDDTFQIIRFAVGASQFAPRPVRGTRANVSQALAYVEELEGGGGTEMLTGIVSALDAPPDSGRLRIVCFLTDGFIGNEAEILGAVRSKLGKARLFSFGVGSSVNRYLLDKLAEEGRGVADFVPLDGETRPIVERFYGRIARPYLTDIAIDWGGLDVQDVDPALLPDLFAGQPLVLAGRYRHGGRHDIVLRGQLGRNRFERRIPIDLPELEAGNPSLEPLWARRRIDGLMRRMVRGEQEPLVREVTDLALEFRLMTRYTSFVAVDNQVVAHDGPPTVVPQPTEMPEGTSYEGIVGRARASMPRAVPNPTRVGMSDSPNLPPVSGMTSRIVGLDAHGLPGIAGMTNTITVRGSAKHVDVKSSDVTHVSTDEQILSLPVESVKEAVALNSGVLVSGGDIHVRGGRANEVSVRIDGLPVDDPLSGGRPVLTTVGVSLEPVRSEVRLGQPIVLRVTLRNTSAGAVEVPKVLDTRDGTLRLSVRLAGRALPAPSLWTAWSRRTVTLKPGEERTYTVRLDVTDGYAFTVPGQYEIAVEGVGEVAPAAATLCSIRVHP